MGPETIDEIGVPVVVQPGVFGEVMPDRMSVRPGFEEWWNQLLLSGDVVPFFAVFNHIAIGALQTDDQTLAFDADSYLISIQGTSTRDAGSFRAQFYEVVDEKTGLSHMRLGINDQVLVGTGQRQAFLPHPYKMTGGQILLSRCLNLSSSANTVQIAIYGVKHRTVGAQNA